MADNLTRRQQHELEFYDRRAQMQTDSVLSLAPGGGKERRPWNSYWAVCHIAADYFRRTEQRVLDLGCGAGQFSIRLANIGYHVTGCDISPLNVEWCGKLAHKYGFDDRTCFSAGVAEQLKYDDASFDMVVGIDVLHHVNISVALREVWRVLKCGGLAVFRDPVEAPLFDALRKTRLVTHFFPTHMSLEEHRTEDERKLNRNDLDTIRAIFPDHQSYRFTLLSRLRRLLPVRRHGRPSRLEMVDYFLMNRAPFLRRFGGDVVHVLKK